MKARLVRIAKFAAYPLVYLVCLVLFLYLTFPMRSLQGRIIAEFDRQQRYGRPPGEAVMTLEIGEIGTHWFSGVELKNVRLVVPAKVDRAKPAFPGLDLPAKDAPAAKPSVLVIDRVRARVRILPLLLGNVKIDFRIDAFGGRVEGTAPYASSGNVEAELEGIHLDQIEPLRAMVQGQPLFGVLRGSILLAPEEGKFAKANGRLELQIDDVSLFDGKTKLLGVALPAAQIGHIALVAKAESGQMTIEELSAQGKDLELSGDGKIRLNETYKRSIADIFLKFKFTDSYRDKDDATRGLLGKPGAKFKPAIEELDPQRTFVRAKTDEGFYRFHLTGRLDKLDVEPAGSSAGPSRKSSSRPQLSDFSAAPRKSAGLRAGAAAAEEPGDNPAAPPAAGAPPPAEAPPAPPPARGLAPLTIPSGVLPQPTTPPAEEPEGKGAPEEN